MRLNIFKFFLILIPLVFAIFVVVHIVTPHVAVDVIYAQDGDPDGGDIGDPGDPGDGGDIGDPVDPGGGDGFIVDTGNDGIYTEGDAHVSPEVSGRVVSNTGASLGREVWVKWTDNSGNYRYILANTNGYFTFPGWHRIGRDEVDRQNRDRIDTDFDGTTDTTQANNTDSNAFQCLQNSHNFTAVRRVEMLGFFSTVNTNLPNFALSQTISDIIWTPDAPTPPPATPIPTPTAPPPPPPAPNPNCYNLQSSAGITLTVGQTTTFTAQFNLGSGNLYGGIAIGQNPPSLQAGLLRNGDNASYPIDIAGQSGTISSDWRPTSTGTYTAMCNSINSGVAECRGSDAYREGNLLCTGPTTSLTINVVNRPSTPALKVGQGLSTDRSGLPWRPYTGNQISALGSNYHNDIDIRVQATPASTITQYYVAFYAKTSGSQISCNPSTEGLEVCLDKFRDRIEGSPQNGFLLKFGRTTPTSGLPNKYWVWRDPATRWQEIPGAGTNLNIPNDSDPLYSVSKDPISTFTGYKWYVTFDESMGSKAFYTGVVAVNSSGIYSVSGEVVPTNLP